MAADAAGNDVAADAAGNDVATWHDMKPSQETRQQKRALAHGAVRAAVVVLSVENCPVGQWLPDTVESVMSGKRWLRVEAAWEESRT